VIEIEFDLAQINRQKHGLSLAAAQALFGHQIDDRFGYEEERWLAIGQIGDHFSRPALRCGGSVYRIISFRRSSGREPKDYAQAYR